ncbi:FG-GAP-like repeat-containing protein [Azospirillum sp.]|uniref:FG-GAP-like repeat-containing protein n=1 Tax=Azospirillum sp. TaxID=34012 RepID=UPI003D750E8A
MPATLQAMPRSSSSLTTRAASASGVSSPAGRWISGASGASYGLLMPVKFGSCPARAFWYSPLGSRASHHYRTNGPNDYTQVSNNILYANSKGLETYGEVGAHNTYSNNLVYGNGTNWILKNGTATGTISADPKFVNYIATGGGDYRLAAGSPAIDAGAPDAAPATDITGASREGAVDVGAFEYRSAASPPAPTVPTVPAMPTTPTTPAPSPAGGVPKDFDGDRRADILWFNDQTRQIALWTMDGGTRMGAAVIQNAVSAEWEVTGTGDVNGDARADILFRHNGTGDLAVWTMDGASRTAGTVVQGGGLPASTRVAGVADVNGDGMADVVLHDTSGDVVVWLMNGTARAAAGVVQRAVNPAWGIAGTGDFDGDGNADILWRRADTGAVAVWTMNGTTRLDGHVVQDAVDAAWTIQRVGDLNGDGKDDVVWRHADGQLAAWLMNGAARLEAGTLGGGPLSDGWGIADASDFDGNGTADLLLRNGVTGGTVVWLMNGMTRTGETTIQASGAAGWQVASGYPHQTAS